MMGTESPRNFDFEAKYSHSPWLYTNLLTQTIVSRSSLFVLLTSVGYIWKGAMPSTTTLAVTALGSLSLQYFLWSFATVLILPAANTGLRSAYRLQAFYTRFVKRWMPGGDEMCEGFIRMFDSLHGARNVYRYALTDPRGEYKGERLWLKSPDGVSVDGIIYRRKELQIAANTWNNASTTTTTNRSSTGAGAVGAPKTPVRGVMLYLGGNGECYEKSDIHSLGTRFQVAVMSINYGDVGESGAHTVFWPGLNGTGSGVSRNGCVMDVCTALAYLVHGPLRVPQEKIIVVGHSIGGGFATEAVTTYYPNVLLFNDRSFSSLSRAALGMLGSRTSPAVFLDTHSSMYATWGGAFLRALFPFLLKYCVCFELDSFHCWCKGGGGGGGKNGSSTATKNKLLTYSDGDRVIPTPAQLYYRLTGSDGSEPVTHSAASVGCVLPLANTTGTRDGDDHNRPWMEWECVRLDAVFERFFRGQDLGSGPV